MLKYKRVIRMYKISAENIKIIRNEMEKTKDARVFAKLQAVSLRGQGFSNDEIATVTGYNSNYISELCKKFVNHGIDILISDGRKGGNNRHMDEIEASEFLEQFVEKAEKGQVVTLNDMSKAYDEATGTIHKSLSSLYYFLHNHNWRKIVPRKQHPGKASDEVIETSKKLTLSWGR
jgi:transposase